MLSSSQILAALWSCGWQASPGQALKNKGYLCVLGVIFRTKDKTGLSVSPQPSTATPSFYPTERHTGHKCHFASFGHCAFFKDFKIWARTRMQSQLALDLEGWSWPLPTNYVSHQAWLTQCWGLYARQALHQLALKLSFSSILSRLLYTKYPFNMKYKDD